MVIYYPHSNFAFAPLPRPYCTRPQVPLVESTMLPQYVSALKARISQESLYLDTLASDSSKQREMCGIMPQQYLGGCVAFSLKMQAAKVQAVQSGLQVLQQMQAQLDTDMAKKLAAFNIVSEALGIV